jgi:3-methyl-2-oxobutanoate hydroxymethyltransferase
VGAAKALESAGASGLVLELVPNEVGKRVTEAVSIPVIGIGAGPFCSGQILNLYDMLDIYQGRKPKFVKNFMTGAPSILDAVKAYASEVKAGTFPAPEHCF